MSQSLFCVISALVYIQLVVITDASVTDASVTTAQKTILGKALNSKHIKMILGWDHTIRVLFCELVYVLR